ncbi:hypothetical protein BMS3Bbin02_00353 [bacterium BMS3Bbin02]|nr:hypothetical protein BMS3Bbin02_00353 [bacterium BMS3Bbin02]
MMKRLASLLAIAIAASALIAPAAASASTTEAIADTGGMTLTLGVLGSPLTTVSVALDDIGHITEVVLDDPDLDATKSGDHKVRFTNADGTTRVEVKAKKDKLSAEIKSADLAAILGSNTWTGILFGADDASQVAFDVIENADGNPEITNVSVVALYPEDATYEIGAIKNKTDDDDEAESSVKITFVSNGYTMKLKIKVEMERDHDDSDTRVKLKVELKGKDQQKLKDQALADLVGLYVWDGRYCDGTPLTVSYTISDTGDVAVDGVTIDGTASDAYKLKIKSNGFEVKFNDSDAKVKVELKQDDGLWDLKVKSETTSKCDDGDDSDDDDGDHNGNSDDDDDDDNDGDHNGNSGGDDDDNDGDHNGNSGGDDDDDDGDHNGNSGGDDDDDDDHNGNSGGDDDDDDDDDGDDD